MKDIWGNEATPEQWAMWAAYFGIDPMQAAAMAPGMASESVRFATGEKDTGGSGGGFIGSNTGSLTQRNWVDKAGAAVPYAAAAGLNFVAPGMGSALAGSIGLNAAAASAASDAAFAVAAGQGAKGLLPPPTNTDRQDATNATNAVTDAQNRQKELDAKIVSEAAAADKKRRAQTLANSRKGTIKTSPLGLPGGGFAQKQLLGA